MNECGYRQMYDVKYLLIQDRDEFVVPTVAEDWSSMIDDVNAEWSAIQRDRFASYSFRNRFFPLGFPDVVDKVVAVMTFVNVQWRRQDLLRGGANMEICHGHSRWTSGQQLLDD